MSFVEVEKLDSVQKAIAQIKVLTSKEVCIFHMREWQPDENDAAAVRGLCELPSPMCRDKPSGYDIFVGDEVAEHMAVHELLHVILNEEQYPFLYFDDSVKRRRSDRESQIRQMLNSLVNKFVHPEIYRRMHVDFGLDMRPYQEVVAVQLHDLAKAQREQGYFSSPIGLQAQVFNLWDLQFLGEPGKVVIDFYRTNARNVTTTVSTILQRTSSLGLSTPQQAKAAGQIFLAEIIEHGIRMGDDVDNDLWRALYWK